MAHRRPLNDESVTISRRLKLFAYPQLRALPPNQWEVILTRACNTPFDLIEWVGILAGVVFAAFVLRAGTGEPEALFPFYLGQFVLALPLLIILVGPFYLRRTRRGLDLELAQRNGGHSWNRTRERQDDASSHSDPARPK